MNAYLSAAAASNINANTTYSSEIDNVWRAAGFADAF
jgi:hypothetical protein